MDIKSSILNKVLNADKRKLGIVVIVLFTIILILFPFIDTNFFYSKRIKNRIDILQQITELDMDKINQNQDLVKEYNSIIEEINESDNNYVNKVLNNNKRDHVIGKIISGGILWWLLGFLVLFFYNILNADKHSTTNKNWSTRIGGFILCVFLGGETGLICSVIPTLFNIWVNYIIIPVVVLVLMLLLLYKNTSNN